MPDPVSVLLEPDVVKALARYATREGLSESEVLRRALVTWDQSGVGVAVAPSTAAAFDYEQLKRRTYLTGAEAAFFCGFTAARYKAPANAFGNYVLRRGIRKRYLAAGGRPHYLRTDLEPRT